jgi:hypothetical protein
MSETEEQPRRPAGAFNVAKCVQYLRWINVDVSDEMRGSWEDAERVHRYLRSEGKSAREGAVMSCPRGHSWRGVFDRQRRTKAREAANTAAATCPECGMAWGGWQLEWTESRSGVLRWLNRDQAWRGTESYGYTL